MATSIAPSLHNAFQNVDKPSDYIDNVVDRVFKHKAGADGLVELFKEIGVVYDTFGKSLTKVLSKHPMDDQDMLGTHASTWVLIKRLLDMTVLNATQFHGSLTPKLDKLKQATQTLAWKDARDHQKKVLKTAKAYEAAVEKVKAADSSTKSTASTPKQREKLAKRQNAWQMESHEVFKGIQTMETDLVKEMSEFFNFLIDTQKTSSNAVLSTCTNAQTEISNMPDRESTAVADLCGLVSPSALPSKGLKRSWSLGRIRRPTTDTNAQNTGTLPHSPSKQGFDPNNPKPIVDEEGYTIRPPEPKGPAGANGASDSDEDLQQSGAFGTAGKLKIQIQQQRNARPPGMPIAMDGKRASISSISGGLGNGPFSATGFGVQPTATSAGMPFSAQPSFVDPNTFSLARGPAASNVVVPAPDVLGAALSGLPVVDTAARSGRARRARETTVDSVVPSSSALPPPLMPSSSGPAFGSLPSSSQPASSTDPHDAQAVNPTPMFQSQFTADPVAFGTPNSPPQSNQTSFPGLFSPATSAQTGAANLLNFAPSQPPQTSALNTDSTPAPTFDFAAMAVPITPQSTQSGTKSPPQVFDFSQFGAAFPATTAASLSQQQQPVAFDFSAFGNPTTQSPIPTTSSLANPSSTTVPQASSLLPTLSQGSPSSALSKRNSIQDEGIARPATLATVGQQSQPAFSPSTNSPLSMVTAMTPNISPTQPSIPPQIAHVAVREIISAQVIDDVISEFRAHGIIQVLGGSANQMPLVITNPNKWAIFEYPGCLLGQGTAAPEVLVDKFVANAKATVCRFATFVKPDCQVVGGEHLPISLGSLPVKVRVKPTIVKSETPEAPESYSVQCLLRIDNILPGATSITIDSVKVTCDPASAIEPPYTLPEGSSLTQPEGAVNIMWAAGPAMPVRLLKWSSSKRPTYLEVHVNYTIAGACMAGIKVSAARDVDTLHIDCYSQPAGGKIAFRFSV